MKEKINIVVAFCLKNCCCQSQIYFPFYLATVSWRLVVAIHSSYFVVADWSESQEL